MVHLRIVICCLLLTCWANEVAAQLFPVCKDTLNASPFYPCPDVQFFPVCGCDNITYRNECEARFRNGVLQYREGPCSGFEFDILPTYVSGKTDYGTTFTIVQSGNPNFSRLFIVDTFGRLWYQQELPAANRFTFTLNLMELKWGVYYLYVYNTQGVYRHKAFVKVP